MRCPVAPLVTEQKATEPSPSQPSPTTTRVAQPSPSRPPPMATEVVPPSPSPAEVGAQEPYIVLYKVVTAGDYHALQLVDDLVHCRR